MSDKKSDLSLRQRLAIVKRANWAYMMKDGEIVEQGEYADLVAAKGESYTMFESQLQPIPLTPVML